MQDIEKQANKKGIVLKNYGNCQFCGADTNGGVHGCFEIYNNMPGLFSITGLQQFSCADAHALQHPEVHGKWNNNLHLARLYLIIERNITWTYKHTPLLSKTLDEYKLGKENKIIIGPPPLARGEVTVSDLIKVKTNKMFENFVQKWALVVYNSYYEYHFLAKELGEIFLEKYWEV